MIDICDWMEVEGGRRGKVWEGRKRILLEMRTEGNKFPSSLFDYQAIIILNCNN